MAAITVAAAPEVVWWAFTHAERVTEFFAPEAVVEARVGGTYEVYFIPGDKEHMCTRGCKVIALEPLRRLAFTWKGPDQFASFMNQPESLTVVSVALETAEGGTRVLIEHTGWGEGDEWAKARSWHQRAWEMVLDSLKAALESGKGNLCCAPESA